MVKKGIFDYFYEKSDDELLAEKAEAIIERKYAETGQPIIFMDDYSEEEKPIINAYREMMLRTPLETLLGIQKESPQAADNSAANVPIAPFASPLVMPPPFGFGNAVEQAFFKSAQQVASKVTRRDKLTPVDATNILLCRTIIRQFNGKFYFFDGKVFKFIPEDQLGSFIHIQLFELVQMDGSAQLIKSVISLLRTHPSVQIYQTTDNPDQLYFLNCALQISTGLQRPVDPKIDFFTTYIPVEYPKDQSAVCPLVDQFLSTCFGGNEILIETAWEMIGYLLTCDMSAKCFFVLVGVGNSGKSVLCRLIGNLFSPGSVSYASLDQLKGRFGLHILQDGRINICGELPFGRIGHEVVGLLKGAVGNDILMSEQKFCDPQKLNPTCKFLFASNFALQIAGADDAFWNRVVVLPFSFAIPPEQQDKNLLDKMMLEAPGLILKAIEAFRRLRERNYIFPIGHDSSQFNNRVFSYISEAETVEMFVNKCCEFAADCFTPSAQLYAAYAAFCTHHHLSPISDCNQFSRKLNGLCGSRISGTKQRVDGKPTNGYRGIRLL